MTTGVSAVATARTSGSRLPWSTGRNVAPESRRRMLSSPCSSIWISTGLTGTSEAVPTEGSSIWPGVIMGAVTMKITSNTSMTSMYGTTLISFLSRLVLRPRKVPMSVHLALQDIQKLVDEAVEAQRQAVDLVRIAVVGDNRRNGGEQADGGGNERLGDPGRHCRQRRLLHGREPHEGMHDAPDRAQQPDVGTDRAGRSQKVQVRFEAVHFTLVGRPHGASRRVQQGIAARR